MWNDNAFTQNMNIRYPIVQAGMAGGITTPELVSAVSNNGCLGMLGAGYMQPEQMQEAIRRIKEHVVHPFGVNLFVPENPAVTQEEVEQAKKQLEPYRKELNITKELNFQPSSADLLEKQIDIVLQEKVPVCSFTFGIPSKETIELLKKNGITVIGIATTVDEALLNQERGMDMVVVQGSEAGGHRGTFSGSLEETMIGTMALVPQVVDHVRIPVIASGGIMDGRGVLAAFVLGADAVQMGTAFVTSEESGAHPQHKEAILKSSEDAPVVTSAFSGKPARGINNAFIRNMKYHHDSFLPYPLQHTLTKTIRVEAAKRQMPEWMSLWCGQGPRLSRNSPVHTIISDIISQVETQRNLLH